MVWTYNGDARNSFGMGWKSLASLLNCESCIQCALWSCYDFSLRLEIFWAYVSGPILDCSETTSLVCKTRTWQFSVLSKQTVPAASTCIVEVLNFFSCCVRGSENYYSCLFGVLDPIPGGCNLEFDLEVDPNIYLDYTLVDIHIKFAPANLGYTRYVKSFSALGKAFCCAFGQDHKSSFCWRGWPSSCWQKSCLLQQTEKSGKQGGKIIHEKRGKSWVASYGRGCATLDVRAVSKYWIFQFLRMT